MLVDDARKGDGTSLTPTKPPRDSRWSVEPSSSAISVSSCEVLLSPPIDPPTLVLWLVVRGGLEKEVPRNSLAIMQASDRPFTELLGDPKQFIVPIFQRDYSWGTNMGMP